MLLSCTGAVRRTLLQSSALFLPHTRSLSSSQQHYISQTFHPASIAPALQDLVTTGRLQPDDSQQFAARVLNALQTAVEREAQPLSPQATSINAEVASAQLANQASTSLTTAPFPLPRGAYLWGTIGSGKTMLLDLFCSTFLESDRQQLGLCRLHFHQFMLTVHSRLHSLQESVPRIQGRTQFGLPVYRSDTTIKQENCCMPPGLQHATSAHVQPLGHQLKDCECRYAPLHGHPVDLVAQSIARDTKVLCLDEMHVTDVADALILGQVDSPLLTSQQCLLGPQATLLTLTCAECSSSQLCSGKGLWYCSPPTRHQQSCTKMD